MNYNSFTPLSIFSKRLCHVLLQSPSLSHLGSWFAGKNNSHLASWKTWVFFAENQLSIAKYFWRIILLKPNNVKKKLLQHAILYKTQGNLCIELFNLLRCCCFRFGYSVLGRSWLVCKLIGEPESVDFETKIHIFYITTVSLCTTYVHRVLVQKLKAVEESNYRVEIFTQVTWVMVSTYSYLLGQCNMRGMVV